MKFELSVGVVEIFPFCVFPYSIKRIPSTYLSFGHLIHIIKTLITVGVRHRKVKWKIILEMLSHTLKPRQNDLTLLYNIC